MQSSCFNGFFISPYNTVLFCLVFITPPYRFSDFFISPYNTVLFCLVFTTPPYHCSRSTNMAISCYLGPFTRMSCHAKSERAAAAVTIDRPSVTTNLRHRILRRRWTSTRRGCGLWRRRRRCLRGQDRVVGVLGLGTDGVIRYARGEKGIGENTSIHCNV